MQKPTETRKWILESATVGAGFLAVYLLTLSSCLAPSRDGISYITAMDAGRWIFHPHHLLNEPLCVLWLRSWQGLGVTANSIVIVSALNAFFGAAALGVVFYLQRRFARNSIAVAVSTTVLIGFSYGFWMYSGTIKVNIIPIALTISSLLFLMKAHISMRDLLGLAVLSGVIVLFHQAYALSGVAASVVILASRDRLSVSRVKALAIYASVATAVVVIGYAAVLILDVHAGPVADAVAWLTRDAREMPQAWNPLSVKTLMKIAIGFTHSFIGGGFVFAMPQARQPIADILAGRDLRSEFYLVRSLSPAAAWTLCAFAAIAIATVLVIVATGLRTLKLIWQTERTYVLPIGTMLVLFSIFFCVWDSSNVEFWVAQMVMCWLLIDRLLARMSLPAVRIVRIVLPLLFFAVNFFGDIAYLRHADNDFYVAHARKLGAVSTAGDLVISDESEIVRAYYSRFTASKTVSSDDLTDPAGQANIRTAIDAALTDGHRVIMSFDPSAAPVTDFGRVWADAVARRPILRTPVMIDSVTFLIAQARLH